MFQTLRSDELPAGEGVDTRIRRVRAGDTYVLVARLAGGQVVAFDGTCPHQVTELDDATIVDGLVSCPRHRYLYDPCTGLNVVPAATAKRENLWKLRPGYLPCFEVEERDGWIWVDPRPQPAPPEYDPALEERPMRSRPGRPEAALDEPTAPAVMIPGPPPVEMPTERSLKVMDVAADSTFDLRLPVPPGERQAWRLEMVGRALVVVDETYEPGEAPHQLVRLAAQGPGASTLCFTYAYPDRPLPAAVRTYIVRVVNA
ncbi:MAG TPA: Rieske (2Fe-2S) protein [Acidimicrobiales bacterium]|nr:Rieske (2Fe-2S) protein [Acidimicrobiales bacterium]